MAHAQSSPAAASVAIDEACANAMNLQIAGRTDLAEQIYAAILRAEPTHAAANHCLGMLNLQLRRPASGLPYLRAALNEKPELPDYWLGYLEALLQAGETGEAAGTLALARGHGLSGAAVDEFSRRLTARESQPALHPEPAAHERPAARERPAAQAPAKLSRAARRRETRLTRPHDAKLLTLVEQRRFDEARAEAAAMTERFPDHGLGWKILGAMLWAAGNSEEALAAMQTSARLMPGDAETHSNLGMTFAKLKRFDEADAYLRRAIEINPKFAPAHYRLGMSHELQGRYPEAEASLRTAVALRSGALTVDDEHGYSNLLYVLSYNPEVHADELFDHHRRFGEEFEADLRALWPRHKNTPDPHRCLQIGFVSADLRRHAVATFLEPVLQELAHYSALEVHAYSNIAIEDEVSARLRQHVKHWHPIAALTDGELSQKIIDDGIDILIDLSGHTGMHRLRTFARKPAPIQVSWIGYPGTTGLRAVDYYLGDRHWLPPGEFDRYFVEKLVYLPAAAMFQPQLAPPPVNALPALAAGRVTFGSFNRFGKINRATVRLWSQLLRALPESVMIIAGVELGAQHDQLLGWFAAEGVARERLTIHPRCGMGEYLALHNQVDLALDTFPYTGGTTTQHALWMGVPTLTMAGSTPAARQGAGILARVGIDGFTAVDAADFAAKGVHWANHLAELADLRGKLRQRFRDSIGQRPDVLVASFEGALRRMWRRWCAGLPAESFEVAVSDSAG
jgi:predicted O-linked N-acetylglucosamine transferase (SPINDLY family)